MANSFAYIESKIKYHKLMLVVFSAALSAAKFYDEHGRSRTNEELDIEYKNKYESKS